MTVRLVGGARWLGALSLWQRAAGSSCRRFPPLAVGWAASQLPPPTAWTKRGGWQLPGQNTGGGGGVPFRQGGAPAPLILLGHL